MLLRIINILKLNKNFCGVGSPNPTPKAIKFIKNKKYMKRI